MDDNARLHLQKMIKANDVEDFTGLIRELKHSHLLQKDINILLTLMSTHQNDEIKVHEEGMTHCSFLFTYYTDIYNKIRKSEIDLSILNKFLNVLRRIEDGELDQHEGSFVVGTILKELYVDSALRKADKLNEGAEENNQVFKEPVVNISWNDYKKIMYDYV